MLWSSSGSKVKRVQGAYISSDEIDAIVACVKQQGKPKYLISDEVFQREAQVFNRILILYCMMP